MKTKSVQSWELSQYDLVEAVVQWLEKKFGKVDGKPISVDVHTREVSSGGPMSEETTHVVEVTAKREI